MRTIRRTMLLPSRSQSLTSGEIPGALDRHPQGMADWGLDDISVILPTGGPALEIVAWRRVAAEAKVEKVRHRE